ncbi:MAG TPA: beta galactosidase jelly roll domain-containing protein, partial [Armatimonadota bacterium]|nr:beta galactosidase jelly roll domain-containing protein [Armatimonadota bacterium]
MMTIPRAEHPRPQFVRAHWLNLNGEWQFTIDHSRSGRDRGYATATAFEQRIVVPFCPESTLSGIHHTDFMAAVWYQRTFTIPTDWTEQRVLVHFGAVDYDAEVWVNGKSVGKHRGGYSSFTLEITDALQAGENVITVCAEDDVRSYKQPAGKQSAAYNSWGCHYTRTTGIWQTVWLEAVPSTFITSIHTTPDLENGRVFITAKIDGDDQDLTLAAQAMLNGQVAGSDEVVVAGGIAQIALTITPGMVHSWEPGNPTLYDLQLTLKSSAQAMDEATSYFGLRSLGKRGPALLLNGKPVFQRLILDQGFYPDGIYTAPSDDELRADIERSMAMGFNGA